MTRRETVSITAEDVTVTGTLESFRMDSRLDYGFDGKRLPSSTDMVRVTVTLYLDPSQVHVWKDRALARRIAAHRAARDRFLVAHRKVTCLMVGVDLSRVPVARQLAYPPR